MASPWRRESEAMDEDLQMDDLDRWDVGKERQKFRRYRTRHLSSSSILGRDLQMKMKGEGMEDEEEAMVDEQQQQQQQPPPVEEIRRLPSLKVVKEEPEVADAGELSFERFASAFDTWLRGFTSLPELLQEFELACRDLAEKVRDEASEKHRVIEDCLMRQKAQILHSEAASWSLVWHLFGKEDNDDDIPASNTSAHIARMFVKNDGTAQLCLRLVHWLEELASKELDLEKKRKGWYAGSYTQKLGLWDQTRRAIKKNVGTQFVRHLDPDAPTREGLQIHREDQKLEEGLLEDLWKLFRAGRIEEAQNLCRSSGQAWRAASVAGSLMYSPSAKNTGSERVLKAIELDGGLGRQRRLWKWSCYCASEKIASSNSGSRYESALYAVQCGNVNHMLPLCSDWESAFWALVRSWLDIQVEQEISRHRQPDNASGPECWPEPVLEQQPRDLINLFQKLYSGNLVNDNVRRSCKEQHRLVQMDLVLTDISDLLDLLKTWILPSQEERKPHGHPQMIRFAAHLVLVLRSILPKTLSEKYHDHLELVGDLILNTYAIFLFSEHKEELVGPYASNLAPHLCVDLYVHMMELRHNDSETVKRKIFYSALEYLPFFADEGKGSVAAICERFLEKSRQIVTEFKAEVPQRLGSARKSQSVQWLCFTPPSSLQESEVIRVELLARALHHSNTLFREISLTSLWRNADVPEGAHILFGHLAEPLKEESDAVLVHESYNVKENYREFLEWQEYFSCDAHYRRWLSTTVSSAAFDSTEEENRSLAAAKQALAAATTLLFRDNGDWLIDSETCNDESVAWLEVSVTAGVSKPPEPYIVPDATVCTALTSALYLCMGEIASSNRQLTVKVSVNPKNEQLLDIDLKCAAIEGEGIGSLTASDGGFLAAVLAVAIKGELTHFQTGVALEIVRMDAWCVEATGVRLDAPFIVRGLCRRCCLPELVLRSMQIRAWLPVSEATPSVEDDLIHLVSSENGLHELFSANQLEEFLLLEREILVRGVEALEDEAFPTLDLDDISR